ncbi:allophanate hydrolase subunit 1 [Streptomyces albus subsp. chlorinus]|uniref:5-oxoprolinase subunit B family protein n=1 Tax=Streptomyces albus TaxID=1888 RepID=UPI00156DB2B5|nr:allophanate hydrolase subunit 1 [Streptomyces albus]NSC21466.1 allophanate hydrolase subunit 1 [Streptomyces albus subsp. chlorinus]
MTAPARTAQARPAAEEPVLRRVGRRGLLVEYATAERSEALHAELLRRRAAGTLPPVEEIVPGATTVLLDGFAAPEAARRLAEELPGWHVPPLSGGGTGVVEIPVRYDGPDLADVAALWGVSEDEVARIHAATSFRVAFCGFAPGFGYLTGLEERYHVPRRATPRTRVPVGAVGLAGPYTGVYPRSSPGGWQLIGTAPETVLWDPDRTPAALLAPGTRVRFVPLDAHAGPDGGPSGKQSGEPDTEPSAVRSGRPGAGSALPHTGPDGGRPSGPADPVPDGPGTPRERP